MSVYREPAVLTLRAPRVTRWQRLIVRILRRLPFTLASRRREWREDERFFAHVDAGEIKEGVEHVKITATNGSVVKNVYVNHGTFDLNTSLRLAIRRSSGRARMPRT